MDSKQLPEGWKLKKLGEVYDVRDGTHDSPKYLSEGYPLITSKNLKSNGLSFDNIKYISEIDFNKINERSLVHKGDILVAMIGTIGNPTVVGLEPDFAIKNVALIKVVNNQNSYFLKYYLETDYVRSKMQREAKGTTQKFVGLGYLRDFPIICPPVDEQKRIVAILDEAFEGIDQAISNTEKNLANARELFDSYLNKIFTQKGDGWIEKTLGEVCDFLNGFAFKSDDVVKDSDVQLIRMGNLYQNILDIERNPVFYPDEFKEKFSRYVLLEGDLIMSLTGTVDKEDYGYTVEVPEIEKTLLLNQRIAKFINIDSDYVDKNFFLYLLRSNSFLSALYKSSRGVRQANLSSSSMKKLTISLPPLDSQKSLVFIFRRLENETQKLETIYRQKLAALNELKQSILQKAFTGQLTSKNC